MLHIDDDEIYKIDKTNYLYINLNIKKINEFIIILLNKYVDISIKNLCNDDIKYLEAIYKLNYILHLQLNILKRIFVYMY